MIDLRLGNVLDVLAQMPSESVHCIVTSPPYWGLRAYGTEPQVWRNGSEPCSDGHTWNDEGTRRNRWGLDKNLSEMQAHQKGNAFEIHQGNTCTRCGAWRGELGLEPTPELFVEHLVQVMREARRVLRNDGVMWINLGDSYAAGKAGRADAETRGNIPELRPNRKDGYKRESVGTIIQRSAPPGLKPKDLVGIPWRVAFALQADGWYLRSDIIWHKPNPMPESVRDRPTKAHEYLFLLSKQPRYFYDADAVREANSPETQSYFNRYVAKEYKNKTKRSDELGKYGATRVGAGSRAEVASRLNPAGRNRRSVWTVTTHPYSGAHFATFPPKLIEPCILAATSERGCCPKCGAPWVRVVEKHAELEAHRNVLGIGPKTVAGGTEGTTLHHTITRDTLGWRASCACDAGEPVPATVLDPFGGSGTTALVAAQHGRDAILIDLKREYLEMARERISAGMGAFADIRASYDTTDTAQSGYCDHSDVAPDKVQCDG